MVLRASCKQIRLTTYTAPSVDVGNGIVSRLGYGKQRKFGLGTHVRMHAGQPQSWERLRTKGSHSRLLEDQHLCEGLLRCLG